MPVSMDDFAVAISEMLDDYGADVREAVNQAVLDTGKQALKTVREKSPVRKGKKGGKYRKGWNMEKTKGGVGHQAVSVTIYNRRMGNRTHIIENGYQKPEGGRVEGIPHVRPAYEEADRTLTDRVARAIEEAGD